MMKTTPLLVVLVVCLMALLFLRGFGPEKGTETPSAIVQENFSHWKLLDEKNIEYQALFPTSVKAVYNTSIDPKTRLPRVYKLFGAEALDASAYLITEIQYPKEYNPSNDPTILDTTISELVANAPTNSLKQSEETVFRGDSAIKFRIVNDKKMVVMGLAFIHNQSIFILTRVSNEKNVNQKEFDYFIESFKFKNMNSPSAK